VDKAANHAERDRLDSWKEIADYVGRDVRTALRWEHERGLPVHRVPGGKRGAVFAFADEIDRWLQASATHTEAKEAPVGAAGPQAANPVGRPRPTRVRPLSRPIRWAVGAGCIALLLGAVVLGADALGWRRGAGPVARVSFRGTELAARDASGRVLWRHDFGRRVVEREDPAPARPPTLFAAGDDLDGDSRPDLLVSVPILHGPASPTAAAWDELFAFSAAGKVLWSHRVEKTVRFGGGVYGPPWTVHVAHARGASVVAFEVGGQKRIAWTQSHGTWWPSTVSVLDRHGREVSTWVHSGVIYALAATAGPEGPLLLAAGISNSRESAFLAVLDARRVEGAGPEEPGSPFACLTCAPGRPLRYFTFQPSEQMLALSPYNVAYDIRPDPSGVEVRTKESGPERPFPVEAVARFSPTLDLVHVGWSSGWAAGHRSLERAGTLDHSVESCPERQRPRVREWDAGEGWRDVRPADTNVELAAR
jgi:hypothetical protein